MGLVNRGSELSTHLLATSLAKNHQVLVLQSGKVLPQSYQARQIYPLSFPPLPAPKNLFDKLLFRLHLDERSRLSLAFTRAALPVLRTFQPDLIICTNGTGQLRLVKSHLPSVKTVVFGRAGIGHDDLANLHVVPSLFIALTPAAYTWAKQHKNHRTQVVYLPNPIDPTPFATAKSIRLNLPQPIILTVSALSTYKNIPEVIGAVKSTKASLLLIGSGEDGRVGQALKTLNRPYLHLPAVAPADLPAYYQAADVFCFTPDPQEAFGRVYLEAMAVGLPIVASDDPTRKGIIGSRGHYANPHNPNSLKRALKAALSSPRLNYHHELEPYLLPTVTKKLTKHLQSLL